MFTDLFFYFTRLRSSGSFNSITLIVFAPLSRHYNFLLPVNTVINGINSQASFTIAA
jgi:hypothetical protein